MGDSRDSILLDLGVAFVEPLHGDRHLLVGVVDNNHHGLLQVLDALDRARGYLRTYVADMVHRSKAPQLSFTVVPEGGGDDLDR